MMFPDSQPPPDDPFWQVNACLGRARVLTQWKFTIINSHYKSPQMAHFNSTIDTILNQTFLAK